MGFTETGLGHDFDIFSKCQCQQLQIYIFQAVTFLATIQAYHIGKSDNDFLSMP